MSISKRKLKANRANAKKSTGPRTNEGRETVSQNRVSHGLCGRFQVLACESQTEYDDLLAHFLAAEQPANDVERELVVKMARHSWLAARALRLQEACFILPPQTSDQQARQRQSVGVMKDIHVYVRYHAAQDRAYQRASSELLKRRKERQLAERGFEWQKRAEAEAKQRAHQQSQRDELHFYKVATAKSRFEQQQARQAPQNNLRPAPEKPLPAITRSKTAA